MELVWLQIVLKHEHLYIEEPSRLHMVLGRRSSFTFTLPGTCDNFRYCIWEAETPEMETFHSHYAVRCQIN